MVSLPSIVGVTATPKLHPQFRKYPPTSFSIDKVATLKHVLFHFSYKLSFTLYPSLDYVLVFIYELNCHLSFFEEFN